MESRKLENTIQIDEIEQSSQNRQLELRQRLFLQVRDRETTSSIFSWFDLINDSIFLQGHNQLGLSSTAFLAVAGIAEKLKVVDVMRAAFRLRHNMVDGEILEGKGDAAAVTKTLLLAEERVLVRLVRRKFSYIGAFGDVFAVYEVVEQRAFCLDALAHQFGGKRREVYAYPLPTQAVSRYAGRGATAEWVQQHISLVR